VSELVILTRLQHPNVAEYISLVRSFGESTPALYVAMRFVDGVPMSSVLVEGACASSAADVKLWVGQILAGLAFLHNLNVLHCNMTPESIYLTSNKQQVVLLGLQRAHFGGSRRHPSRSVEQYTAGDDLEDVAFVILELLFGPRSGTTFWNKVPAINRSDHQVSRDEETIMWTVAAARVVDHFMGNLVERLLSNPSITAQELAPLFADDFVFVENRSGQCFSFVADTSIPASLDCFYVVSVPLKDLGMNFSKVSHSIVILLDSASGTGYMLE